MVARGSSNRKAGDSWWHTTTLPEILGVSDADEDLYAAMDWPNARRFEKKLAARHLQNDGLALDLTSSSRGCELSDRQARIRP